MSGQWSESLHRTIALPEEEVGPFHAYITYVYKDYIDLDVTSIYPDSEISHDPTRTAYQLSLLTKLYALGQRLDDKRFRNCIIDQLFVLSEATGLWIGDEGVAVAFAETMENSILCRLLVDVTAASPTVSWLEDNYGRLPVAFLKQVTMRWAKAAKGKNFEIKSPVSVPRCTYHEHDEEVPMEEACMKGFEAVAEAPVMPKTPAKKRRR